MPDYTVTHVRMERSGQGGSHEHIAGVCAPSGTYDSIPAGPLSTRVRIRIAAEDAPAETLREIVEWAHRHSPAGDAMQRAVPTTVEVDVAP